MNWSLTLPGPLTPTEVRRAKIKASDLIPVRQDSEPDHTQFTSDDEYDTALKIYESRAEESKKLQQRVVRAANAGRDAAVVLLESGSIDSGAAVIVQGNLDTGTIQITVSPAG